MSNHFDCVIVGAGIAGLMAARRLQENGRRVVLLDKGRGVGGRMATRRFADSVCDHGAQFLTVRSETFQMYVDTWVKADLLLEWFRHRSGKHEEGAGHPRFRGAQGMTSVPKALAAGLNIRLQSPVLSIRAEQDFAHFTLAGGTTLTASAVIVTAPVPQALVLLEAGDYPLAPELARRLAAISYDPCFAVMARLDGPSGLPAPGMLPDGHPPIAWMADNQQKGISATPAVTVHADGNFSRSHWNGDRDDVANVLIRHAEPFLTANVIDYQIHGWRYSQPIATDPAPCAVVGSAPLVVLAGDAFQGARVEGAALSGLAAAGTLLAG